MRSGHGLFLFLVFIALTIAVPPASADTYEPNGSIAQAYGPLQSGVALYSYISNDDDWDWFYFDASLGEATITLAGIPVGADYDLYLTDETGETLIYSANELNSDEVIVGNVTGAGRFYVRIESYSGYSDIQAYRLTATFTPMVTNQAPTVTVLSPNGGETLTAGTVQPITWTANDPEDGSNVTVDISYSVNGGGAYTTVATGIANSGSYSWTVPGTATTSGLVRVVARDTQSATGEDVSNAVFTIQTVVPALVLSLPAQASGGPNAVVQVPVGFSSNVSVGALQFAVDFNPAVLTGVSVTAGQRATGMVLQENHGLAGQVRVVVYSPGGGSIPAGSGTLCTLTLQVVASPPGNANLTFSESVASSPSGAALTLTTQGGGLTPVTGVSLLATRVAEGICISWTALADGAHVGFRVLRDDGLGPVAAHVGLLSAETRTFVDTSLILGRHLTYWLEAIARDGTSQRFGPVEIDIAPRGLWAGAAYPNPARGAVNLRFDAMPGDVVRAAILDIRGTLVRLLEARTGSGELAWDGRLGSGEDAPAGVYFVRLDTGAETLTRKFIRLAR